MIFQFSRTFQGLCEPWSGVVVGVVAVFVVVSMAVVVAVVVVVVVVVLTLMHQYRYLLVPQRRPSHVMERTAASIAFRSAK